MDTSSRAPSYDVFKLVVVLILLLMFLFLLFWGTPSGAPQPAPLPTFTSQLSLPALVPSLTASPLPATSTPTITATPAPTDTQPPTLTPTIVPPPTASPVRESTAVPATQTPEETNACETVSPSQLQVGMRAQILRPLNLRSSPGVSNNWLLTNVPGTPVEIIGGPACTRYGGGGTYLWWQIRLLNGQVGWSVEASASGKSYFMEPIP